MRDLRNRRLAAFIACFAFPVIGFLLSTIFGEEHLVLFCLGYVSIFVIVSLRASLAPCPNCQNRFFLTGISGNLFANKCAHCGASIYAEQ